MASVYSDFIGTIRIDHPFSRPDVITMAQCVDKQHIRIALYRRIKARRLLRRYDNGETKIPPLIYIFL
jgi:hypothetical protein